MLSVYLLWTSLHISQSTQTVALWNSAVVCSLSLPRFVLLTYLSPLCWRSGNNALRSAFRLPASHFPLDSKTISYTKDKRYLSRLCSWMMARCLVGLCSCFGVSYYIHLQDEEVRNFSEMRCSSLEVTCYQQQAHHLLSVRVLVFEVQGNWGGTGVPVVFVDLYRCQ
jgi:hypothetical protein